MAFRLASIDQRAVLVDDDDYYDVAILSDGSLSSDPMKLFGEATALQRLTKKIPAADPTGTFADAVLDAPVPRPSQVFGIGLNYGKHAAESGMEPPTSPVVFTKFPSCIGGPGAEIPIVGESIDYEIEVVVVIGTGGSNISREDAWSHVFGITGGQDISDRALQFAAKPAHFDLGKSRQNYGILGPVITSVDAIVDRTAIGLECTVNGDVRQRDTTAELIFDVPHLIEYLSGILTLRPGDCIFTGTPDGVGMSTGAFLSPGDEIVSTVQGVGTMRNRCVSV